MPEPDYKLRSNPATALISRVVILCIGGLMLYAALPTPFGQADWWNQTSEIPFIAGGAPLLFGIFAPNRWCEQLVSIWPYESIPHMSASGPKRTFLVTL